MTRLAFLLVVLSLSAVAQDNQLAALRATLLTLREHRGEHDDVRGATLQLTVAKHQLRDWIESRLARFAEHGNEKAFAEQINLALRAANLFCDDACGESALGSVYDVAIRREGGLLVVQTAVGILCGNDESAYLYERRGQRWQRLWESEQNVYTKEDYRPQTIQELHVSEPDKGRKRLILTVGEQPWCSSDLQDVYYRAWQIRPGNTSPKLLLQRAEWAYVSREMRGLAGPGEILVEFSAVTLGADRTTAVRKYTMQAGQLVQVEPIALTPRDFVAEWLTHDWTSSEKWSESDSLQPSHRQLTAKHLGDLFYPTKRCSQDFWEVGNFTGPDNEVYFLIRWNQPYNFRMVRVSYQPSPDCVLDPEADKPRSLFPGRN